jgi:hypothetical protein
VQSPPPPPAWCTALAWGGGSLPGLDPLVTHLGPMCDLRFFTYLPLFTGTLLCG